MAPLKSDLKGYESEEMKVTKPGVRYPGPFFRIDLYPKSGPFIPYWTDSETGLREFLARRDPDHKEHLHLAVSWAIWTGKESEEFLDHDVYKFLDSIKRA